ncbi:MAG: 7-cyano-7-deazaguanine synthase QueC [Candidatus Bathyarchaeota archaeon]|nr:7-cyano-7-deazaguanine synthase QueC [Candidatus Bathyarchaeota archaeon]
MKKAVVILSGGPDSVTVAYWAKAKGYDVHAVTFNYGQKAQIEILKAVETAAELGINHKVIDLSSLSDIYEGVTSLVDKRLEVTGEFTDPIIVPFRNGVFIAVTVAYADGIGANHIFYGAHASDEPFYPDCRKEFYEAFQEAARLGTEKPITIMSPYSDTSKSGILEDALKLGVPLEKTWSCYLEGPVHCGGCESCNNRKKAFIEAGIPDPTEYIS